MSSMDVFEEVIKTTMSPAPLDWTSHICTSFIHRLSDPDSRFWCQFITLQPACSLNTDQLAVLTENLRQGRSTTVNACVCERNKWRG